MTVTLPILSSLNHNSHHGDKDPNRRVNLLRVPPRSTPILPRGVVTDPYHPTAMYKYSRLPNLTHRRSRFAPRSSPVARTNPDPIPLLSYARRLKLVQNHIYHKTGRLHPIQRLIDRTNALKPRDSPSKSHALWYLVAVSLSYVQQNLEYLKLSRNPKILR